MRRDDGELIGFVEPGSDGGWRALVVFGAELTTAPDRDTAIAEVRSAGLGVLAERWWYLRGGEWLPAAIQEAGPGRVVAVVGDDSRFVGVIGNSDAVPALTLTGSDAAALRRRPPEGGHWTG
ncbi:hypothetical protein GCM10023320_64530 [Pseudonocardia adelaidensis]|uniref:Immunity protein 35 of polymorphic toxin system n=1 Tax=Pseudonocardia adelaidensis TaxID=648754 RepID=A0ABP9NW04_9PSEU